MELAHAAFALVFRLVPELPERFGGTPDFRKRRFAHVAAIQRQVTARLYLPGMAYKKKPGSAYTPRVMASMPNVAGVTETPSSRARWRIMR